VNGWSIPEKQQEELAYPFPRRLRGGQLGCLLSHLSILFDAKSRGFKLIWVMEDDAEILESPQNMLMIVSELSQIDPEWDIFYTDRDFRDGLGGYVRSVSSDFRPGQQEPFPGYYQERININEDIMQIRSRFGTYSMLISNHGMEKILEHFTTQPLWTAIDIDIHYIPGIRQYSSRRDIVSNLIGSSSDTLPDSTLNPG
jgi:hypothetical protein